ITDTRVEEWMNNDHIREHTGGTWTNHPARRKRKLLLHREEINRLDSRMHDKGYAVVPPQLYFVDGRAKVEIALGRGKKAHDKRQTLRERQDMIEARREMGTRRY